MSTESRPRWFFKPNYPVLGYFKICVVPSGHYMLTPLFLAQIKDRLAPFSSSKHSFPAVLWRPSAPSVPWKVTDLEDSNVDTGGVKRFPQYLAGKKVKKTRRPSIREHWPYRQSTLFNQFSGANNWAQSHRVDIINLWSHCPCSRCWVPFAF